MPHFPLAVFLGPLRFVAQNLRIPVISQQELVFDSFLRVFVFDVTTHCHQQCVQVQTLPTAQVPSALTDSLFSRGF